MGMHGKDHRELAEKVRLRSAAVARVSAKCWLVSKRAERGRADDNF